MKQHNNNNESLTCIFIRPGDHPTNIDPNDIDIIVKYSFNCYGLDLPPGTSFEALRLRQLLNTPNICLRTLVPSYPALEQHVRRACISARYLWKLFHLELDIPYKTSWNWKRSSVSTFSYIPLWQACTSSDVHSLLKTWSCSKDYVCSCEKAEWTVWSFASVKNQNANRLCSEN